MQLHRRHFSDWAWFIGFAPVLSVIYIGCLIHLAWLFARLELCVCVKSAFAGRGRSMTRANLSSRSMGCHDESHPLTENRPIASKGRNAWTFSLRREPSSPTGVLP